jgi:hypothetical protein
MLLKGSQQVLCAASSSPAGRSLLHLQVRVALFLPFLSSFVSRGAFLLLKGIPSFLLTATSSVTTPSFFKQTERIELQMSKIHLFAKNSGSVTV